MPLLTLATERFGIEVARIYGSSEAPNTTGSLPGDSRLQRLADDGALMPGTEVRIGSAEYPLEGLLRGPAVFLGYADPADNAAAFEDGWFRTGDAVEVHDRRLTVVGRIKDVVNRNGLKISPGEIDAALAGLPVSSSTPRSVYPIPRPGSASWSRCVLILERRSRSTLSGRICEPRGWRRGSFRSSSWSGPSPCRARRRARWSRRGSCVSRPRSTTSTLRACATTPPRQEPQMNTPPEDHVAISDLLARYCLTLDFDDVDAWVALFTAEATYEVYGRSFDGHEGLRRMLSGAPGGLHLGGPPSSTWSITTTSARRAISCS